MSKELVIGSNRHETKVAILEEDQLVEVYFQRANEYSLAGSIHKGRVTRVLPGMQSAFVDLGLERDTFLYVSDFFEENEDIDTVAEDKPIRNDRRERNGSRGGDGGGGERREIERPILSTPVETSPAGFEIPEALDEPEHDGGAESNGADVEVAPANREGDESRQGNDRGVRGGDRRGRRSRRRRPRTQGFPDNKYAQPNSGGTQGFGGTQVVGETQRPDDERNESRAEVLLLPGESLAKYRNRGPEPAMVAASDNERFPESAERDPETDAEIESEAEEIAFTDQVFAHHDDQAPPESEVLDELASEKEDAFDEPVGEMETWGISDTGTVELRGETYPLDLESIEIESIPAQAAGLEHEPSDFPFPLPEPVPLDEFEVLAIREALPEDDDLLATGLLGAEDPLIGTEELREELESLQGENEPSSLESLEVPAVSGETAQTASVREQGGRYMHRASRRMRRRRGGNRSGQTPTEGVREPRREAAPVTGGGAAAGAALAPEPRVEPVRERSEVRTAVDKTERVYPSIADLLKPGQEIIVQIAKEPLGQKGARITSHIALPGRFVVFMPSVNHLGVSRKVASDEERQRLKRILQAHRVGTTGGFIVRTAGEGIPEDEIAADMNFLYSLWLDIRQKAEKKPAPALLHYDLDVVQRILRDQVTEEFKAVWVDNEDLYESVVTFMQRFQPALVNRVKMYTRSAPIFDAFNITQELEKALRPKVWLKSGGYIVINQTEALVAIDINTGKYVGKSNRLEDTIVKTNTEAVKEIVRQIRLRDLGGIIVVDFIDMDERKNRQKVMQALEEAMGTDKAPYKILQFNDFGLVAITRKRVKQSLERTLCSPCPYCEGAGYVKSVQTVISEILVEAQKLSRAIEGKDVVLRVHPEVAKVLKASSNQYLEEVEEILGLPVMVNGDPTLHHQKFDLA